MKCRYKATQVAKTKQTDKGKRWQGREPSTLSHRCQQQWEMVQPRGDQQFHTS